MKKVKIALLGFGNVGRGVWKILQANGEEISKRSGYKVEVGKILVRNKNRDRGVKVPDEIITTDFDEILNDDPNYDDLEKLSLELAEFNYYYNTKK